MILVTGVYFNSLCLTGPLQLILRKGKDNDIQILAKQYHHGIRWKGKHGAQKFYYVPGPVFSHFLNMTSNKFPEKIYT